MPTRGPVTRTVRRSVTGTRGFRRGLPVGTRPANVSTLTLRRPVVVAPGDIPEWAPLDTLTIREVAADGHVIGHIAAHSPAPRNATRPTAFVFRSIDGAREISGDFLDSLRCQIDSAYPEGAELPTRKD